MNEQNKSRITLQDIADQAGVTAQTVANILQGRTRAKWPKVAERVEYIRKVAADMGYRPHAHARATATGHCNTIGMLMSVHSSHSMRTMGLVHGVLTRNRTCFTS